MGLSPTQTQSASRQLQPAGLQSLLAEKWRAGCSWRPFLLVPPSRPKQRPVCRHAFAGGFLWGSWIPVFAARSDVIMALGFGCQGPVPAMYSCTVQAWPASQEISSSREESRIQLVVAHGGGRTVTWGPVTPGAGARRRPSAHSIDGAHHGPWTRGGMWSWRRQARPQPSAYAALHTKEDSWKQHLAVVQGCTAPPAHGWMSQQALESVSRADTQSASCRRMMAPRWRLRGRGQGAGDEKAKCVAPGRLGAKAHRI